MSEPMSDTLTVRPTRTTLLFVTAAAVVIVVGGIKAANHIVAPVMLSVSLVIVVHPLRARFERHMPRWAASVIVLITTVMLILSLAIAVAVLASVAIWKMIDARDEAVAVIVPAALAVLMWLAAAAGLKRGAALFPADA